MTDKIAEILNIEPKEKSKEIVIPESEITDITNQDEAKDYQFVRNTLRSTVNNASDALEGILNIADDTDDVEAYTAVASMVRAITESSKTLYEMHYKRKKTLEVSENDDIVLRDTAVFVGTTAELLAKIEEHRKNVAKK